MECRERDQDTTEQVYSCIFPVFRPYPLILLSLVHLKRLSEVYSSSPNSKPVSPMSSDELTPSPSLFPPSKMRASCPAESGTRETHFKQSADHSMDPAVFVRMLGAFLNLTASYLRQSDSLDPISLRSAQRLRLEPPRWGQE